MKAFAVGCFHFALADDKFDQNIKVTDYIEKLKATLEWFDNISNVSVLYDSSVAEYELDAVGPNPRLKNGDRAHPQVQMLDYSFDLYLPKRVQAELLNCTEEQVRVDTENFKITSRNTWYGPVTFIECVGATITSSPSESVVLTRRYLESQIPKTKYGLNFDFIGPSPFHADFYLLPEQPGPDSGYDVGVFKFVQARTPGYDDLNFRYDQNSYSAEEEALDDLYFKIADELSFYYLLKVIGLSERLNWDQIQEKVSQVIELEEDYKPGLKNISLKSFFLKKTLLKDAFRMLGIFRGQKIINESLIASLYSGQYKTHDDEVFFMEYVDRLLSTNQKYPTQETIDLLNYFDQKITKSNEFIVAIIASILGGIVGALVTQISTS